MKQPMGAVQVPIGEGVNLQLQRRAEPRERQSACQHIRTEQVAHFGSLYCLNGDAMASVADEFMIHESLAHPVALAHAAPRTALVLGGGDGGTARELLKHPSIASVVIAELDEAVVAQVRADLPSLPAGAFNDPRVSLRFGDAAATLAQARSDGERFDLILFDLTASDDPACAHLHDLPFLRACAERLNPGGGLHVQLGSPFYQPTSVANLYRRLTSIFPCVRPALVSVPLYGGPWLLAVAHVAPLPEPSLEDLNRRLVERAIPPLRYYNPALHRASFALPTYVHTLLAP